MLSALSDSLILCIYSVFFCALGIAKLNIVKHVCQYLVSIGHDAVHGLRVYIVFTLVHFSTTTYNCLRVLDRVLICSSNITI